MGSLVLLALGGLYAVVATVLLALGAAASSVTWLWLLALLAAVVGAFLLECRPTGRTSGRSILEVGLLLGVLTVAVWLRFPDLATIPPNVHGDEVSIGLDARKIWQAPCQPSSPPAGTTSPR